MNDDPVTLETPLDLLTTYLTPAEVFFVRNHWTALIPDPGTWTLTIDGDVARPLKLTMDDLRRMPRATTTCVLECAGNGRGLLRPRVPGVQWKYGAMGNARWTGVTVANVLERAGLKAGAKHLHAFGSDDPPAGMPPFHRSLDLGKALADCIIAYEMNGQPLPPIHGGPARLVVPGWTGNHWMKWLTRIEPRPKPQAGFYMDVAYRRARHTGAPGIAVEPDLMDPVTELFVKATITQAPRRARVGSMITIRGVAFSALPDSAMVALSDDNGATWTPATLGHEHDPYAWRLWSFEYVPAKIGTARLMARAVDARGGVQPREAVWNRDGYSYNGWHSVEVEVSP